MFLLERGSMASLFPFDLNASLGRSEVSSKRGGVEDLL